MLFDTPSAPPPSGVADAVGGRVAAAPAAGEGVPLLARFPRRRSEAEYAAGGERTTHEVRLACKRFAKKNHTRIESKQFRFFAKLPGGKKSC